MFDNIGHKIKMLAKVLCWVGIIFSVAVGILFIRSGRPEDGKISAVGMIMTLIGFSILVGGSLFSWVGSFVLYGFGQLVENSDALVSRSKTSQEEGLRNDTIARENGSDAIPAGFFKGNKTITEYRIKEGTTGIGAKAFYRCTNLQKVWIPDSVRYIGAAVFSGCKSLMEIRFEGTRQEWEEIIKSVTWNLGMPRNCSVTCERYEP